MTFYRRSSTTRNVKGIDFQEKKIFGAEPKRDMNQKKEGNPERGSKKTADVEGNIKR